MIRNLIKRHLSTELNISVSANLFSYLVAFCASIIYVHLLGKTDFGLYTFAFNIVTLFLLLNGFGAASGVLQYVSHSTNRAAQEEYLRFAFQSGSLFNFAIGGVIILYAVLIPLPIPAAKPLLIAMALVPSGRLYLDVVQAYMRASGQNRLQAKFAISNNCILLLCNILGIMCFGLYGLVYFTYIAYGLMLVYASWRYQLPPLFKWQRLQYVNVAKFISFSFFTTLTNACSGLLFVLDLVIISYVVKSPQLIASYKVATLIPFAINFIPGLVANFYYPQFVRQSPAKVRQLARYLSLRMLIFSALISLILVLLAKPLILGLFGANYHDSIRPFQIISAGYWLNASFRTLNGNILAALGKAKLSFYQTVLTLLINLGVTYFMVIHYSINGAAMAIVIIYAFSSLFNYLILKLVLARLST